MPRPFSEGELCTSSWEFEKSTVEDELSTCPVFPGQSKDEDLVGVQPLRHFTDSKIRCHLFCCVAALTYLRRLEKRFAEAGVRRTARDVMTDMLHLHSVLSITDKGRTPVRRLEMPTKTQADVLKALGYQVDKRGVLQPLSR